MICRYLPYTLRLRAPALLATVDGDPNSSTSLPYVPGAALRGAVARALGDPGSDEERARAFRTLILDGQVRYLNAYPRVADRRSLPAPISLRIDKAAAGSSGELVTWDLAAFGPEDDPAWPDDARATLSEPFVSIGAAQPRRVQPEMDNRFHHQRERARGRAWKVEYADGREEAYGALFAFEFLEAGQQFDGMVQISGDDPAACDALTASVQEALAGTILVGRSRRGGYGGDATLTWGTAREREVEGQGVVNADLSAGTVFRTLLVSPYIGRDPEVGQIDPVRLEAEVCDALGGRVTVVRRCWAFERVGGFNRKWRLELPQAQACAAGSVLVLRTQQRVARSELLAVEHRGLGERRVEGFGRVVFLDAPVRTQILRTSRSMAELPEVPSEVPEVVHLTQRRMLDAAVARAIDEHAARLANAATSLPTPSVIGRLRNVLRVEPELALGTLEAWLAPVGDARLRAPAMAQLERCRLNGDGGGRRLADWLRDLATSRDNGWLSDQLGLHAIAQRCALISEDTAREHLRRSGSAIRARLANGALASLARRSRRANPS